MDRLTRTLLALHLTAVVATAIVAVPAGAVVEARGEGRLELGLQALAANRFVRASHDLEISLADHSLPDSLRARAGRALAAARLARQDLRGVASALAEAVCRDPGYPGNPALLTITANLLEVEGLPEGWASALECLDRVAGEQPFVLSAARHLETVTARLHGDFEAADSLVATLHPLTDWLLLGPFENRGNSGLAGVGFAEREIDGEATYEDLRGRPVRWRKVAARHEGKVDLDLLLDDPVNAFAYALTQVRAGAEPRSATLLLGGSGAFRIWLNGELVLDEQEIRAASALLYEVPVHLDAGWNRILVKTGVESEGLHFRLWLADDRGRPLPVQVATDPAVMADGTLTSVKMAAAPDEEIPTGLDRDPGDGWRRRWLSRLPVADLAEVHFMAMHLHLCDFSEEARDVLEEVADRFPESAILDQIRVSLMAELESREAEHLARLAAERAPEHLSLQISLIAQTDREGDEEEAWRRLQDFRAAAPGNPWVLAAHSGGLAGRGSVGEGLAEMRQAIELAPGSRVLRQAYLGMMAGDRPEAELEEAVMEAVAACPDDVGLLLRAAGMAADRRGYDEALVRLEAALRAGARPDRIARRRAGILESQDRVDAALTALEEGLAVNPGSTMLLGAAADLLIDAGREQEALPYLDRYLEVAPGASAKRELVRKLRGEAPLRDLFSVVEIDSLLAADLGWIEPGAVAVQLLDEVDIILYPDGSHERYQRSVTRVLDEAGVERFRRTGLPGRLEVARCVKPDGRRIEPERTWGSVTFSELEPGDVIELQSAGKGSSTLGLAHQFWTDHVFERDIPVLRSRFAILLPDAMDYTAEVHNLRLSPETTRQGDLRLDVWEADRRPAQVRELRMPPLREQAAWLDLSTVPDWRTIVDWYEGISSGRLRPKSEVHRLAEELAEGAAGDSVLVARVANHVCQNVKNGGGTFLDSALVPRSCEEVLRSGRGDCKDQAALVIALLREMGIEAVFALVNSRKEVTQPYLPSPRFTHAIAHVRTRQGRVFWVDTTAKGLAFPNVPIQLEGASALIVDPAAPRFVTIGLDAPEDEGSTSRLVAKATPTGDLEVRGSCSFRGEEATGFRLMDTRLPERLREAVQVWVGQRLPGATVTDYALSGARDLEQPLELSFDLRQPAAGKLMQGLMVLDLPWTGGRVPADLAQLEERRQPLLLDHWKGRYREELELHLPEGYQLAFASPDVALSCDLGRFRLDCRPGDDGSLLLTRELEILDVRVAPESYGEFRDFVQQAYRAERQPLLLRKVTED